MNKTCTKCSKTKEVVEFFCRRDGRNGLNSQCKVCKTASLRRWREKHKKRLVAERKADYANNSEELRQRARDWRARNPERAKEISRKSAVKRCRFKTALQNSRRAARSGGYSSCNATIEELKAAFTGFCAICAVPQAECTTCLVMDHDHEPPGYFRGWLCRKCNSALGHFGDNEELLINALHYLMSDSRQQQQE